MTQPWSKKVMLSERNGDKQFAILTVAHPNEIILTTGYESANLQALLGEPVSMTPNMAGDLAHALDEAKEHAKEKAVDEGVS